MANSMLISSINHCDVENKSLLKIYDDLRNVFSKESFGTFIQKCKQIQLNNDEYRKQIYFPVKCDPTKLRVNLTSINDYLNRLPDEDPNGDLKSKCFTPIEIFNDGSVLFRAVALLLGFSTDDDVRELRLRCLHDATSNLGSYIKEYENILEPLLYPDEANIKHWSNFVHEKVRMDAPNIITVLTLIALAKVINIPIRSIYPTQFKQGVNGNSGQICQLLNQVFYPCHNQQCHNETMREPIIILWWCTDTNGVKYCDHVVPLFPTMEHVDESMFLVSLEQLNIARRFYTNDDSSEEKPRGTFILIATSVHDSKTPETSQRIEHLKVGIIELMKKVALTAQPSDIIELNTCDEELTEPPLIPFCEAAHVDTEANFNLIRAIQFHEITHSNLSSCIAASINKLARQWVYYTDFFFFADNSLYSTIQTSLQESIVSVLTQSESIKSQIIIVSDESNSKGEQLNSLGIPRIDYLHTDNHYELEKHHINNDIRHQTMLLYERNHPSEKVPQSRAHGASTSNTHFHTVPISRKIRLAELTDLKSKTSKEDQNNRRRFSSSDSISPNPTPRHDQSTSPRNNSRRTTTPLDTLFILQAVIATKIFRKS